MTETEMAIERREMFKEGYLYAKFAADPTLCKKINADIRAAGGPTAEFMALRKEADDAFLNFEERGAALLESINGATAEVRARAAGRLAWLAGDRK